MGSYECTNIVNEPLCGPTIDLGTCLESSEKLVSEHQPCRCSISIYCLSESNSNEVEKCPVLSRDDILISDGTEPTGDWLVTQCENADESTISKELYYKCGISDVCLDKNPGETDACSMNSGRLMQCNKYGVLNMFDGFKLTSEIIARDTSPGVFTEKNEENVNNSVGGSPEQMVQEITEEDKNYLIEIKADTGELLSPSVFPQQNEENVNDRVGVCPEEMIKEVMEENKNYSIEIKAATGGLLSPSISTQQNEENVNDSVGGSPDQMVKEVMEENKNYLNEIRADTGGLLLSPSRGNEASLYSMSVDPLVSDSLQKNKLKDTEDINSVVVLDGKNDTSDKLEMFNRFASALRDHIEPLMPKASDLVMYSVMDTGSMGDKHVIRSTTKKNIEVAGIGNSFDDSCITIFPSTDCQKTHEILQHDGSLTMYAQESECLDEKSSIGSLGQRSVEVLEDCNHTIVDTKVDVTKNAMLQERNSNLKEGFITTRNSIADKLTSQEPCHPFDVLNDESSVMINAQNITVGDITFLSFSKSIDSSEQIDDGGRDNVRFHCLPEVNCVDAVESSSGLNAQRSKSVLKARTKKLAKRGKNSRKVAHSCRNIQIIFKAARRKRTCLSKRARTSIWGSLSFTTQSSLVNSEIQINQFQNQEVVKRRKGRHSVKQNKNKGNQRSKGSKRVPKENLSTSSGCIRLKVKLGKQMDQSFLNIMVPDVDTSSSATATNSVCATESYWKTSFDFPETETVKQVNSKENPDILHSSLSSINPASNVSTDSLITMKTSLNQADESIGISSNIVLVQPVNGSSYSMPLDSGANGSSKELSIESFSLSKENEFFQEDIKIESSNEAKALCENGYHCKLSESTNLKDLLPSNSTGHNLSKSSKFGKANKGRSKTSDSAKKSGNAQRQRKNQRKSVNENKLKKVCDYAVSIGVSCPESGNFMANGIRKTTSSDNIASRELSNLNIVNDVLKEKYSPRQTAWVLCDDCQQWRRIPAVLVETIGEASCTWTCKENTDKSFADCSIPQEKSNAEINAELELSDGSGDEKASRACDTYQLLENQRSTVLQDRGYTRIKSNQYLHRTRKSQTIDEMMICHCKAPRNGKFGCGDECLNRMLNIECARGTCPCGDLCSNLQFQKRNYAKLGRFKCGKKGYGLQLLEDISQGQFLIEYVGEVLDMPAYEARQKEYAMNGHRHFYFMTLNCNEVIDASAKGNLGRFINHSCDPNCRTEKWMVNGEICIGLFALRDIKKGEEVTFDYNYVRIFGAAAKKCYCGSPQCQGSIGGDPLNSGVIVQSDSDEEYLEPGMFLKDSKASDGLSTRASSIAYTETITVESISNTEDEVDKSRSSVEHLDITKEQDEPINDSNFTVSEVQSSLEYEKLKVRVPPANQVLESSQQTDVTSQIVSTAHPDMSSVQKVSHNSSCIDERIESPCLTSMNDKLISDGIDSNQKSKFDAVEHKRVSSKPHPRVKTSRKSGSIKKGNVIADPLNSSKVPVLVNKSPPSSVKPKKIMEDSLSSCFEAVEEKLNELLDTDGGITKRKDAAKGYLKLLLLTAASGDRVSSEAIQSNRDLSMILDALLKTKSRMVLTDIINKNGLQMLHNMMKQYRMNFKKIPILRKLLKVLEYLAVREILSAEHVNAGPRCPGMESFAESMLSLTEHDDKQVHQIARNFRDKWIHRPFRKFSNKERDDWRMELHRGPNCNRFSVSHIPSHDQDVRPTETMDDVNQSIAVDAIRVNVEQGCSVSAMNNQTDIPKPRKRKSRWDQPAVSNPVSRSLQSMEHKLESSLSNGVGEDGVACGDKVNSSEESNSLVHNTDDVPPGFSPPLYSIESTNASPAAVDPPTSNNDLSKCFSTVPGHRQDKFISRLPVSYGVPLSIVQQFGTPRAENQENWIVAPGMPFYPFPPLPPFNKENKVSPPSGAPIEKQPEEKQWDNYGPHTCCNQQFLEGLPGSNEHPFKRARGASYDLGKKYFKQQKWDNAKHGRPWLPRRNECGYLENIEEGECPPPV